MSQGDLKKIALIVMIIDHIGTFIPNAPIWFNYIGRISAPLFIYCSIQAYLHTRNKVNYLLRLYCFSLIVAAGNMVVYIISKKANLNLEIIRNNFIGTLFICVGIVFLYEKINNKWMFLIAIAVWQVLSIIIIYITEVTSFMGNVFGTEAFSIVLYAGLGIIPFCEGGFAIIILYLLLYFTEKYKNRVAVCASYALYTILLQFLILRYYDHPNPLFGVLLPFPKYQGFMILAVPIIWYYNGTKGKALKYFYYIFYPVHIWALFFIGAFW